MKKCLKHDLILHFKHFENVGCNVQLITLDCFFAGWQLCVQTSQSKVLT